MSTVTAASKLAARMRLDAVMRDGRSVLIQAEETAPRRTKRRAARNLERWNRGLRPNRFGIWS